MIALVAPPKGTVQAKVMKFIIVVHVVKDNHLFARNIWVSGQFAIGEKKIKKNEKRQWLRCQGKIHRVKILIAQRYFEPEETLIIESLIPFFIIILSSVHAKQWRCSETRSWCFRFGFIALSKLTNLLNFRTLHTFCPGSELEPVSSRYDNRELLGDFLSNPERIPCFEEWSCWWRHTGKFGPRDTSWWRGTSGYRGDDTRSIAGVLGVDFECNICSFKVYIS